MTVYLYQGTPGSGKSYHAIKDAIFKLKRGGNVIANFSISVDKIKLKKNQTLGKFVYVDDEKLTPSFLLDFYRKNHTRNKEGQTLIIIDECQIKFDPKDKRDNVRRSFCRFFSLHRKLGFNVILISQSDRLIDRQIRCNIEYSIMHRKLNNYKLLSLLPFTIFICNERWYGSNLKLSTNYIFYSKKVAAFYDSFKIFNISDLEELENNSLNSNKRKNVDVFKPIIIKKDKDVINE